MSKKLLTDILLQEVLPTRTLHCVKILQPGIFLERKCCYGQKFCGQIAHRSIT